MKKLTKFWTAWLRALKNFGLRMKGSYQKYFAATTVTSVPQPQPAHQALTPAQTYLPPKFDPNTGKKLTPSKKVQADQVPRARFDPETGKKIVYTTDAPVPPAPKFVAEQSIPIPVKMDQSPLAEDPKNKSTNDQASEVYTVLESDIRARLLSLPVTTEERNILGRSFIYLSEDQQRQYLTEIERVNEPPGKEIEKLIETIHNLPIPTHQQDFLVDQLNYIPETDHQEFASALKPELTQIPEDAKPEPTPTPTPTPAPSKPTSPEKRKKAKKTTSQPRKKKQLLTD